MSILESRLVNRLAVYAERLEATLHPVFGEAIARAAQPPTIHPESNERVTLPYTVAKSRPRPDLEAGMLDLVNRERVANGLRPLALDPELTQVAQRHSADMFARLLRRYAGRSRPICANACGRSAVRCGRREPCSRPDGASGALWPDELAGTPREYLTESIWPGRNWDHGRRYSRDYGLAGVSQLAARSTARAGPRRLTLDATICAPEPGRYRSLLRDLRAIGIV